MRKLIKVTIFTITLMLLFFSTTCIYNKQVVLISTGSSFSSQRKIDSILKKLDSFLFNLQKDFFSKKDNLSINYSNVFHDISDKQKEYIKKTFKRTYPIRVNKSNFLYSPPINNQTIQNASKSNGHFNSKQEIPNFTKGIFLKNSIVQNKEELQKYINIATQIGVNTFVIDIEPQKISEKTIQIIRDADIFTVARLVVFPGGLKKKSPSNTKIQKILSKITEAKQSKFSEVQLDYIRYADSESLNKVSLDFKYKTIKNILDKSYQHASKENLYLSSDLFGRITLNQNDRIGQKLEIFSPYMDTIYPMLYPSHYYNDPNRRDNPYETVLEGINKSKRRIPNKRIVAYIQGFQMHIKSTGLSYAEYIEEQIIGASDSLGDGYILWNQHGKYDIAFQVIQKINQKQVISKKSISKITPN